MFGFIASPCRSCARDALPAWRGTFCGLARCLARDYGVPARLLVNRDAGFLALLGLSLDPDPPRWRRATCCNPLATPFPVNDDHPAIRHAAAVSVCGLAAKLDDDATDEGPLRRGVSRLAGLLTSPATDRAIAELNTTGFPTSRVLETLRRQDALEARSPLEADRPTAEAFGAITAHLAEILPLAPSGAKLEPIGRALGSLVYWCDAWEDRPQDLRRGRFNPYLTCPGSQIHTRVAEAWKRFTEGLGALPLARHAVLVESLQTTTARRHQLFLASDTGESGESSKRKRRKKREKNSWCDWCDPCFCDCPCGSCSRGGGAAAKGGRADACFDCGPGDSGCCDCCPCDGCSCS